jgi:hypothetical protein
MNWKIKTVDAQKNLQAEVPGERLMLKVVAVLKNTETKEEVTIPFTIENKDLMDRTLLSIVDRMNKTEADFAVTPNGEAYEPTIPEAPVELPPSPEQVAFEIARNEWRTKERRLKEFQELGDRAQKLGLTPSQDLLDAMKALGQDVLDMKC